MRLTYLLIDLENVHPAAEDISLIRGAEFRVRIFHGPHQSKFDAEMVKAMQPLGDRLEFVQCDRSGKNALDFHVAFYLGRLVQECEAVGTPTGKRARFFIISKDAGFDALLDHIRSLGYEAARVAGLREALFGDAVTSAAAAMQPAPIVAPPPRKVAAAKSATEVKKSPVQVAKSAKTVSANKEPTPSKPAAPDPWVRVLENLRDHPNNRPTTLAALERHLSTIVGKQAAPEVVKNLIARLDQEGIAVVRGKKIEYKIPKARK